MLDSRHHTQLWLDKAPNLLADDRSQCLHTSFDRAQYNPHMLAVDWNMLLFDSVALWCSRCNCMMPLGNLHEGPRALLTPVVLVPICSAHTTCSRQCGPRTISVRLKVPRPSPELTCLQYEAANPATA